MAFTWAANPGSGKDMGSELLRCDDNLTGAASGLRCSGRSSQRGVPGLLPSETSSAPATRFPNMIESCLLSKLDDDTSSGLLFRLNRGISLGETSSRSSWWLLLLRAESDDGRRILLTALSTLIDNIFR